MDEPRTCGQGLAENAAIPAKLGLLMAALAENLEAHLGMLDVSDPAARVERDAYVSLARAHRRIAAELQTTAGEMEGYRELPMGHHDVRAMQDPRLVHAFESFIRAERALLDLLRRTTERDEKMLAESSGG